MEILKLYNDKNYKNCIKRLKNVFIDGETVEINDFMKQQSMGKLRVWIKITDFTLADNINYRSESNLLITLVIEMFAKELDVESVNLSNKEIIKLIKRFSKAIKFEYAYRGTIIDKKPKYYTLLKDIQKSDVEV